METESGLGVTGAGKGGDGELLLYGDRASVWGDDKYRE